MPSIFVPVATDTCRRIACRLELDASMRKPVLSQVTEAGFARSFTGQFGGGGAGGGTGAGAGAACFAAEREWVREWVDFCCAGVADGPCGVCAGAKPVYSNVA